MDIIDANRPSHRYPKCCSWTVGHLGEKHHIHPHFQVRNPTCPWHFPPPHPYLSPLPPLHQPLPNAGDGAPEPSQDPRPHLPSSPSCLLHTPPPLTSITTPSLSSMHGLIRPLPFGQSGLCKVKMKSCCLSKSLQWAPFALSKAPHLVV